MPRHKAHIHPAVLGGVLRVAGEHVMGHHAGYEQPHGRVFVRPGVYIFDVDRLRDGHPLVANATEVI